MRGLANLQQEFAGLGELENLVVVKTVHLFAGFYFFILTIDRAAGALCTTAVAAKPNVALVVDRDAVRRVGPIVTRARTAPVPDQVSLLIELQNRRRRRAALRDGWIGGGVLLAGFEGTDAVNDPDMTLQVGRNTDRLAENPVVGQRLGPIGVHFEARSHHRSGVDHGTSLQTKKHHQGEA